jgi:hypothetical protein
MVDAHLNIDRCLRLICSEKCPFNALYISRPAASSHGRWRAKFKPGIIMISILAS